MSRCVRGSLFVDYVRMIRARKDVSWELHLEPGDLQYVNQEIDADCWYPMETFERLGNAILSQIACGQVEIVRVWGRVSVGPLTELHPDLVVPGDPLESFQRFQVIRSSFFDFEAFSFENLAPGEAQIAIHYYMGETAEEAASFQALGFFEGVLEVAGGRDIEASFSSRSWAGDDKTLAVLRWK
jgi:hypothetical protein